MARPRLAPRAQPARTLRRRLLVSLAAMLVPLVAVAAAGLVAHGRTSRAVEALGTQVVQETRALGAARDALYGLQVAVGRRAPREGRVREARRLVELRLAALGPFSEGQEHRLVRAVGDAVDDALDRERPGARHPNLAKANALLTRLSDHGLAKIREDAAALRRSERRQLLTLLALLLAASSGALLLARRLTASLQRPLLELRRAARRLGNGDLDHRVALGGDEELRELAAAFNTMAERLVDSRRQLVHQAFHDALTGLPNRALLGDRAEQALSRGQGARRLVAALFLDLDDFKGVNDSLGHRVGDELLVEVAGRLRGSLRPEDTIARLGGDEFAVLLEHLAEPGDAVRAAERILLALSAPVSVTGRELHVRASVGVAVAEEGTGAEELLRNADAAMYQVKADGKGGYRSFEPWMHSDAVQRLELEDELRLAIDRHQLQLHYQPVVDLASGEVTGIEALVRWLHPRRGLLAPSEFIPLAESTGLIVPLGRWVLDAACARLRLLDEAGLGAGRLNMSVNVSAGQLRDPDFVAHAGTAVRRNGLAPERLVIEITETLLMADLETSASALHALKALGVRVALDDFGTGYSSLGHLRQFPVDVLKIDSAFVDDVADDAAQERVVVAAILGLGRTLGLATVAEGIERADQRHALMVLGCQGGQGYHFARPLAGDALSLFLADRLTEPAPARSAPARR